jgi:hypothetical protein
MANTFVSFSYSKDMLCHRINQDLFDGSYTISKQEKIAEETKVFPA